MAWNVSLPPAEYYPVADPRLGEIIAEVIDQPRVAIDTETTGLSTWSDLPLFFSLAWGSRRICLPAEVLHHFSVPFKDPEKEWLLANAKFDMHMLANANAPLAGKVLDIQVMHAMLYEEDSHTLDFMGQQLLGWSWKDMFSTWDKRAQPNVGEFILGLFRSNPSQLIEYASNDAFGTLQIADKLEAELRANNTFSLYPERYRTLWDYFYKIEAPFTRVLWKCERNGILIDPAYLKDISVRAGRDLDLIEREIHRIIGRPINMNSPVQMREYFIDTLKLRPLSYSDGGKSGVKQAQIDYDFLSHYAIEHPVAQAMLRHRDLKKLKGTYADGLPKHFDRHNRIHTRYNQDVARCLPAGELVLTSRGYLAVEQVIVGDLVIAHTGKPRRVTECSVHAPTPIYKVRLSNGLELRTTGHHQYLIGDKWIRADQLQAGMGASVHSDSECWSPIAGWPFEVSSWGRVRSQVTGKVYALQPKGTRGHLRVTLTRNRAQEREEDRKDFSVHRLVLGAFKDAAGGEVRHLDGIVWNNTISNLCYGTYTNKQGALRWGDQSYSEVSFASFFNAAVVEVSVEEAEVTYGLTVEEDYSHVTGGIVTHNTGRLSSSSPNLQNIPNAEDDIWQIRAAFIAPPGKCLIDFDYSALEMRLLAAAAQEPGMIESFRLGQDPHAYNASITFSLPYDDIVAAKKKDKKDLTDHDKKCLQARKDVKTTVGFGVLYGMKEKALAVALGCTEQEAVKITEAFMARNPAVKKFMDESLEESRNNGYAFTILGRRRFLPGLGSPNRGDRSRAERQAGNLPIQGSAADAAKMAMILIDDADLETRFGCRMLLQIHDEIIFECPEETADAAMEEIRMWMEHPFPTDLSVELKVEGKKAKNWASAK